MMLLFSRLSPYYSGSSGAAVLPEAHNPARLVRDPVNPKPQKVRGQFATVYELAVQLSKVTEADALLVLLEEPADWQELKLAPATRRS